MKICLDLKGFFATIFITNCDFEGGKVIANRLNFE